MNLGEIHLNMSSKMATILFDVICVVSRQIEGDVLDIPAGGFSPIQNVHIMKQMLFINVHLAVEDIDIRWDGGQ